MEKSDAIAQLVQKAETLEKRVEVLEARSTQKLPIWPFVFVILVFATELLSPMFDIFDHVRPGLGKLLNGGSLSSS
ncbi:MAG: hypothetical protein JO188_04330 [Hyphomicrobiales bacterium]|nr:hypothetical protein [Hyphomicrobiales bacterium]